MANGEESGSAVTGLLEGLVSGFQTGHDFRTRRTLIREDAVERARQRARQERLDAEAGEDRAYERAVGGLELRERYGLEYDPSSIVDRATNLRAAVGATLAPDAPQGFRRVGPSAEQRENTRLTGIRKSVGQFLSADPETRRSMLKDPNTIEGLGELGFDIDAYIEATTPGAGAPPRTGIVRSGNRNLLVDMTTGATVQDFDPIESPGSGGTDPLVSRRLMLQGALGEIDEIYADAYEFGSSPERLTQANQRANAVALRYGFTTLRELTDAARQMNIDLGVIVQPPNAAPEGDAQPTGRGAPTGSQRPTLEQRVRELRAQGVEREQARRMLEREGYDVR